MGAPRQDFSDAVSMYERGLSVQDVADAFSVSRQSMWMALKRRDVAFRPHKRFGQENHFYRGGAVKNASLVVIKAVRKGILIVKPCEVCGLPPKIVNNRQRIHAHHDDYNHLLDVRWFCKKHHDQWHQNHKPIPKS